MAHTFGGPADDIDGLCVFGESREVLDFAILTISVNFPDLLLNQLLFL